MENEIVRNGAGGRTKYSRDGILEEDFRLDECRAAAEGGDSDAQGVLGDCYQYGWFVEKDYAAAVSWYEKAAAQGNAAAQSSLGACWRRGNGGGPRE